MRTNRIMTRILSGITLACLLVGCGSQSASTSATTADTAATQAVETVTNNAAEDATETAEATDTTTDHSILVVYFSGTGNTARVAQVIADTTGGDLFEVTPVEPYTSEDLNYNDDNSRVSREHADASLQDIELTTTTADGWENYDVVFIGYPIWWGGAAWPINQFVSKNDYTGKTLIPFTTSASSGIGESASTLAALAGTGDWQEGQRFSSSVDSDEVAAWVTEVLDH